MKKGDKVKEKSGDTGTVLEVKADPVVKGRTIAVVQTKDGLRNMLEANLQ